MASDTMSDEVRSSLEKMAAKLKDDYPEMDSDELVIDDTHSRTKEDIDQELASIAKQILAGKLK